jgi:hypothetical protein
LNQKAVNQVLTLVKIFEIRARATLVYPQIWSAEGTRNKPGVSHEAHPTDGSWDWQKCRLADKEGVEASA